MESDSGCWKRRLLSVLFCVQGERIWKVELFVLKVDILRFSGLGFRFRKKALFC